MLRIMTEMSDPTPTTESDLVTRLRAGEDAAYEELVRTYAGRLLGAVRRYLPAEEDARDAVQETFLSAFKAIDRFESGSRIYTWLYRIAINAALMHIRRRGSRPEESVEDLLPRFGDDDHLIGAGDAWNLADGASPNAAETRVIVRQAIEQLQDSYRAVLLLRDIEGMNTEEAARALETTPGAVKVRLHRARQALRELLDRQFAGGRDA